MRCSARDRLLASAILAIAAALPATAADLRPSWECLPEDTGVMVRMPQPAEFLEAVRTRTKFGGVMLGDQRLQGLWNVFLDTFRSNDSGKDLADLEERLAKYGLEKDDVGAMFRGDAGAGFVFQKRGDGMPPLVMVLAWMEPGAQPAERLVGAMKRRVEERNAAGEIDAPKRIDLDMAGHEVLWMVEPILTVDMADLHDDDGDLDAEEFKKRLESLRERAKNATFVQTGQTHAFLARVGGRLLAGHTMPTMLSVDKQPGERDFDAESGTEDARAIFERFLAAHAEDGESPLASVLQMPGMATALPGGIPLVDVVVDPRVLIRLVGDEGFRRQLAGIGADDLGPLAWRQSLDEGRFHSGMFLSLPAPRRSLMRILDQECDASEVPSFVTREAVDLTQISLDLGKAYETVREFAIGQGGPETANMFTAIEAQAQGWLGIELQKLLASLGTRHWIISYPPQVAEAFAEARKARAAGGAAPAAQFADRAAIVWQIDDETPFGKILQRLAGMAGGGEMQEEQGFRGFRIPDGPAIYMGQGHLVIAIGKDSLEKTLTAVRNPPTGEFSLRESEVVRRAAELLPLEPARMFGLSDSSKSGGTLGMLREMAAAMVPEDVEDRYREVLAGVQKLLPADDEMEGMFGIGATTLRADDAGVSLQSVWEMPAP